MLSLYDKGWGVVEVRDYMKTTRGRAEWARKKWLKSRRPIHYRPEDAAFRKTEDYRAELDKTLTRCRDIVAPDMDMAAFRTDYSAEGPMFQRMLAAGLIRKRARVVEG